MNEIQEIIEEKKIFYVNLFDIFDNIPIYGNGDVQKVQMSKCAFYSASDKAPYSKDDLICDVAQRRIALSAVLEHIEKSSSYRLEVDLRTGAAVGVLMVHKPREPTTPAKKGINAVKKIIASKKNPTK